MALRNIFRSKNLLEQILWNELIDDGMTISCQLDIKRLPNLSPVHVLGEQVPFKFQTCVCKTDEDTLSLNIRSRSGNITRDLSWPVVVQWNVSVINENTEATLDLNTVTSTFTQTTSQSEDLTIHLSEVKDFIDDNSLLLRWKLKVPNQPDTDTSSAESEPLTQSQTCERPNIKEEIQAVLGLTQDINEQFDTDECREKISCLHRKLTESSTVDECFNSRIEKTDQRIDKLIEQFNEEAEKATQCLAVVRDAASHIQAWAGCVDSSDEASESAGDGEDTSSDKGEGSLGRQVNLLLIGKSQTGKSATANSILLKNAFETGQPTSFPRFEEARITVATSPTTVTVVEVSNLYLPNYKPTPFQMCPGGFDAILCIDDYRNIKIHKSLLLDDCLGDSFIDHEALKSYGIVVLTGGDSFKMDNPNITIEDWLSGIRYKGLVQSRVILFDNTTRSKKHKLMQLTNLVQLVDSLATSKTRFTETEFMESETRFLKSKLKNFRFPMQDIIGIPFYSAFNHNEEWRRVMQAIEMRLSLSEEALFRQHDLFKAFLFGRPKNHEYKVHLKIAENGITCQNRCINLKTRPEIIKDFETILLMVSCSQLSSQDKDDLRSFKEKYSDEIFLKGILIVIDGGDVDLRGNNDDLLNWCSKENDIVYEMFKACAERALLYDYETRDDMAMFEQANTLFKMLISLRQTSKCTALDTLDLPNKNPDNNLRVRKRKKLEQC